MRCIITFNLFYQTDTQRHTHAYTHSHTHTHTQAHTHTHTHTHMPETFLQVIVSVCAMVFLCDKNKVNLDHRLITVG